jgi:4-hydroxy-3-methylbut-2-enyl diphosphate reductase
MGIMSYANTEPLVVQNAEGLDKQPIGTKVGILAQTTQTKKNFIDAVVVVLNAAHECRAYNTICNATVSRQTNSMDLAKTVDVMFVVGGKNSANTTRLADLCRSAGTTTYHIESAGEIEPEMLRGNRKIGITAGASTPRSQVDEIRDAIEKFED